MSSETRFIAEFEHHSATIAMYPFRTDIWRDGAVFMRKYVIDLVKLISNYEPVILVCRQTDVKDLDYLTSDRITIVPMEYDDIWARDIGPTFIKQNNTVNAISWAFNSWGGLKEGSYYPWDKDNAFACEMANYLGVDCEFVNIVLEGGAILTDGEGTLFTTKSVLLNRNRNPFKSKRFIEDVLKKHLFVEKVVWLEQGLAHDETNGHIDNVLSVVRPHEICIAWTDNKNNPNYKRVRKILKDLQEQYDCIVHKIPLPTDLHMTKEESAGLSFNESALDRNAGDVLPASYLNFYPVNGGIILPAFGCEEDQQVYQIIKDIFPQHSVEQIYSREPLLGGGGIHCILHEVPDLR